MPTSKFQTNSKLQTPIPTAMINWLAIEVLVAWIFSGFSVLEFGISLHDREGGGERNLFGSIPCLFDLA
jgi:hypothetical protein